MVRLKVYCFLIFLFFSCFHGIMMLRIGQYEWVESPSQIGKRVVQVKHNFTDVRLSNKPLGHVPVNGQISLAYFLGTIVYLLFMIALYQYLRRWELQGQLNLQRSNLIMRQEWTDPQTGNKSVKADPFSIPGQAEESMGKEVDMLRLVNQAIENNLDNQQFDTQFLCKTIGMSRANLYRKFKVHGGVSIARYIRRYRLYRAKKLLESTDLPVGIVAGQVGYKDFSHFSRSYKNEFGIRPSEVKE